MRANQLGESATVPHASALDQPSFAVEFEALQDWRSGVHIRRMPLAAAM
jgi:hypothetical protein